MNIELTGPWSALQINAYLASAEIPLRLSVVAADGFPRVVSLWFQHADQQLFCVTHRASKLAKLLENDSRVGFEISADAPPYHGIRGQGSVSLAPLGNSPALEQLLGRYVGDLNSGFANWLLSRSEEEILITLSPHRLFSWDYRERMAEIV